MRSLPLDSVYALGWSERLLALAIVLQSVELLQIRNTWSDTGIWRWSTLRKEHLHFPKYLLFSMDAILSERGFSCLVWTQLLSSLVVWISPTNSTILGLIFLSTWLISIRWRGTFNGGSDSMTAIIALSLWIAQANVNTPWVVRMCLGYIAVQTTLSYVIAGWVKLRNPTWRSGQALPQFIRTPGYDSPVPWIRNFLDRKIIALFAGWIVIAFECMFPLAWTGPRACLGILALSFVFHLVNYWVFGLNRFVFAWAAAYPALYFWSLRN